MSMMSIPLPDALETFVDAQAKKDGLDTGADYVLALIERERDRHHLRELILEGARSGVARVVDDSYFEELRALIRDKAA